VDQKGRRTSRDTDATVKLRQQGHVAYLTLNRPDALNAINTAMAKRLFALLEECAKDRSVWLAVITGEGRSFCSGADLKERATFDTTAWQHQRELFRAMFTALRQLPQPAIAAVRGYALGGGTEIALLCDLTVAADDAIFGLPEATLGIIPGGNGVISLTRAIGPRRAKELLFSGRRLAASEALELGLVHEVVKGEALDSTVDELVGAILGASPTSTRAIKKLANVATGSLRDALDAEEDLYQLIARSPSRVEGLRAFMESRRPQWPDP